MRMLSVQVIDAAGRALGGIPVRLSRKQRGFLDFTQGATTRSPSGMCELGPLAERDKDVWVAHIGGLFLRSAGVDVDLAAAPAQPVQLLLADFGALDIRLFGPDGVPFSGSAELVVGARDASGEETTQLKGMLPAGSSEWSLPLVGLGLSVDISVRLAGVQQAITWNAAGPTVSGERLRIDIDLGANYPCLSGRVVDSAGHPLRYRSLELSGAWSVDSKATEFTAECVSDATGRFACSVDAPDVQLASGNLLVYCEMGEDEIGTLVALELRGSRAELGQLELSPPVLLAEGRVIDRAGLGVAGLNIELMKLAKPDAQSVGWAKPTISKPDGAFELLGWASGPQIEVRAKYRIEKALAVLRTPPGARGLILNYGESPSGRNP
jgi:hypothetical protein